MSDNEQTIRNEREDSNQSENYEHTWSFHELKEEDSRIIKNLRKNSLHNRKTFPLNVHDSGAREIMQYKNPEISSEIHMMVPSSSPAPESIRLDYNDILIQDLTNRLNDLEKEVKDMSENNTEKLDEIQKEIGRIRNDVTEIKTRSEGFAKQEDVATLLERTNDMATKEFVGRRVNGFGIAMLLGILGAILSPIITSMVI